jgi:putative peptidoglycan lipid II flippase
MSDSLNKFQQNRFVSALFRPFSAGAASILLVLASLLSYVGGLFRDILLGNYFGASGLTDMYNSAFLVPDLIYTLTTAGALSGIFLPVFRNRQLKNDKEGGELAGSFLILSQLLVLGMSVLAFIFMPMLLNLMLNTATANEIAQITQMSRIMLLSPIIFTISNTFGSILITFKHYLAYAFSAAFYNIGILIGLIFFHESLGIMSGVLGVVIGLALHLGFRLIDYAKLDFGVKFKFWSPGIKEVVKLAAPKTISLLTWQSSLWFYNIVGYTLMAGSISAFYYARNIQSFAVSIFGIAIATSVFPFLVDMKEEGKIDDLVSKMQSSILQILVFTVPAAVGLALLDTEVVEVLLGRGAFDETDIILTAGVLFFFAFSIPFESLMHLFSRVYYAFHNTVIPVLINILFLVINVGGTYLFAQEYGVNAFSIFFTVASVVQISLLCMFIGRFVRLKWGFLLVRFLKILLASGVMGVAVYYVNGLINQSELNLVVTILVGVVVYFVVLKPMDMIRYTGMNRFMISLKRVFKR